MDDLFVNVISQIYKRREFLTVHAKNKWWRSMHI